MLDSPPKESQRPLLPIGCVAIAALLVGAGYYLHRVNQGIRNSYAVWWVADMVVEHLIANDNQWPKNWDDLRDDYQTCIAASGQPWSFAELSSRTRIDWHAEPAELLARSASQDAAQFRVITLADGTDSHWESHEPNQIILEYLRSTMPDQ